MFELKPLPLSDCEYCKKPFTPANTWQRTCSKKCASALRVAARRATWSLDMCPFGAGQIKDAVRFGMAVYAPGETMATAWAG